MLLKDSNGEVGNVMIDNIPQGLVKPNESSAQAAVREVIEETGHTPTSLVYLGNYGFDIANSSSLMPFYLAVVPFEQEAQERQLDTGEHVIKNTWSTWKQLDRRGFIDGKTIIALHLARKIINPKLL